MFRTLAIFIVLMASISASAQYASNAFVIQNDSRQQIITNGDIECIKVDRNGKGATIGLSSGARRFLYEYSVAHKGEYLSTLVCGRQISRAVIAEPLSLGEFRLGGLDAEGVNCLKQSFDVDAVCRPCPICKVESQPDAAAPNGFPDYEGFRLMQIEKGSLYEKLGLESGDIVKSINGIPLKDSAQAIKIIDGLRNEKEVALEIERRGQPKTIKMKVTQ